MAEVLLFHHVQGLTEGIAAFADELREAGHVVTVPDLYDGATFATMEEGFSHAKRLGEDLDAKSEEAVAGLSERLVYAGFSMGAMTAHQLAQTRPGARGALLYHHGDVPVDTFGDAWPEGVDLQIHIADGDPFYEPEVVEDFVKRVGESADAELFVYPGSAHLFTDSSLPGYDPEATMLVVQRSLDLLDRLS